MTASDRDPVGDAFSRISAHEADSEAPKKGLALKVAGIAVIWLVVMSALILIGWPEALTNHSPR